MNNMRKYNFTANIPHTNFCPNGGGKNDLPCTCLNKKEPIQEEKNDTGLDKAKSIISGLMKK